MEEEAKWNVIKNFSIFLNFNRLCLSCHSWALDWLLSRWWLLGFFMDGRSLSPWELWGVNEGLFVKSSDHKNNLINVDKINTTQPPKLTWHCETFSQRSEQLSRSKYSCLSMPLKCYSIDNKAKFISSVYLNAIQDGDGGAARKNFLFAIFVEMFL